MRPRHRQSGLLLWISGLLFLSISSHSNPLNDGEAEVVRAQGFARSISRLQEVINQTRGVVQKGGEDSIMSNPPLPEGLRDEAKQLKSTAESWGCEMVIRDLPPQEIEFGDQKIKIYPFELAYSGIGCPLELKASMKAKMNEGRENRIEIESEVAFIIHDEQKVDQFGFVEMSLRQDITVILHQSEQSASFLAAATSKIQTRGGKFDGMSADQDFSLDLKLNLPFDLKIVGRMESIFSGAAGQTKLLGKQTIEGFASQTEEYFLNDQPTEKENYEKILQGMQYFGIDEDKLSESKNTLACTFRRLDNEVPSGQGLNFCGQNSQEALDSVAVEAQFLENWLLVTLRGSGQDPLEVYVLYDEKSHFTREYGGRQFELACAPVVTCGGAQ